MGGFFSHYPALIFSGESHDFCAATSKYSNRSGLRSLQQSPGRYLSHDCHVSLIAFFAFCHALYAINAITLYQSLQNIPFRYELT